MELTLYPITVTTAGHLPGFRVTQQLPMVLFTSVVGGGGDVARLIQACARQATMAMATDTAADGAHAVINVGYSHNVDGTSGIATVIAYGTPVLLMPDGT